MRYNLPIKILRFLRNSSHTQQNLKSLPYVRVATFQNASVPPNTLYRIIRYKVTPAVHTLPKTAKNSVLMNSPVLSANSDILRLITYTNFNAQFLYSLTICMLHDNPRHVSSINMPIFRRTNCIITASGIVTLCKLLYSMPDDICSALIRHTVL